MKHEDIKRDVLSNEVKSSSPTVLDEKFFPLLREILASDSLLHLKVISQSMSPFLQTGDTVIVEYATPDDFHPGDIIVFEKDRVLITHRLVIKGKKHWVTKGDNALNPDPPLKTEHILGKVSAIQRGTLTRQMHSFPWKGANWIIARINHWQILLLRIADQAASRLFGNRQFRGLSLLNRMLTGPLKLISKLLIISLSFFE